MNESELENKIEQAKEDFIKKEKEIYKGQGFWSMAIKGALATRNKNGKVYSSDKGREEFKRDMGFYVKKHTVPQYKNKVSDDEHIENIEKIKEYSKKHGSILEGRALRIGVCQKLINLYLKYLWCQNLISTPPHCPFDGIVINGLAYSGTPPSWTTMDDVSKYRELVEKARVLADEKGLGIAEWELLFFNDNR